MLISCGSPDLEVGNIANSGARGYKVCVNGHFRHFGSIHGCLISVNLILLLSTSDTWKSYFITAPREREGQERVVLYYRGNPESRKFSYFCHFFMTLQLILFKMTIIFINFSLLSLDFDCCLQTSCNWVDLIEQTSRRESV